MSNTHKIFVNDGTEWIVVREEDSGHFVIIDDSMTEEGDWLSDCIDLGLCDWNSEVQDIDAGDSDESQCFGMSTHLVWKDVTITPSSIEASSLERLSEALTHITFCSWCPGDI